MLTVHSIRSARLECMNVSCDATATHSVKAMLPINDCKCEHVEMFCGLRLCLTHALTIGMQDVLPESMRAVFCESLEEHGSFNPDFLHAEIIPVLLDDISMLMQERVNATIH